jgi:hypothetical protein
LTFFADGAILVAYQVKRKAGRMMFPIDQYHYKLKDYGLSFDCMTYEEERTYRDTPTELSAYIDGQYWVDKPTGAIQIIEERDWGKETCTQEYCVIRGILASTEVDETGYPKYRRLVEIAVLDTSDEYVRAVLEKEGLLADRWTYEGKWSWQGKWFKSLPTRGMRRFLDFVAGRGWYRT